MDMVQICDYSSLIFAGNTTVLLVLSLTTDYWEYRSFDQVKVTKYVKISKDATLIMPYDTESYFQLRTVQEEIVHSHEFQEKEQLLYHPPLFVRKRFIGSQNRSSYVGKYTCSVLHEMTLFLQYGNLFRDCDELEDLDVSASLSAVLCMVSVLLGFVTGGYGLFSNYTCLGAYKIASCLSLIAGFFLTLSIALFHGKCYILRKMPLLPNQDLPFKEILEESRVYSYGWSFSLAWICVFFCYTSSFVWLTKSQGPTRLVIRHPTSQLKKRVKVIQRSFWRPHSTSLKDIATV